VLAPIDVAQGLARVLTMALLELLVPVKVLIPLEPIKKNASESLVEVFLYAGDNFLQDVGVCRTRTAMRHLGLLILVEKLCDGDGGGSWCDFVLLGDFLPVVYEDGFESVWDEDFDSRSAHELIFLQIIQSAIGHTVLSV